MIRDSSHVIGIMKKTNKNGFFVVNDFFFENIFFIFEPFSSIDIKKNKKKWSNNYYFLLLKTKKLDNQNS